jgi:hypothetical protein
MHKFGVPFKVVNTRPGRPTVLALVVTCFLVNDGFVTIEISFCAKRWRNSLQYAPLFLTGISPIMAAFVLPGGYQHVDKISVAHSMDIVFVG